MGRRSFNIYKSHGGVEHFSKKKLFNSLKRTGLPFRECEYIANLVAKDVGEGSRTKDIYRKTLSLVNKTSHVAAVHYSLKRAIFDLGPTGHHFESYVARYFEEIGFKTTTCQTLKGLFVCHEVDVIAVKSNKRSFVECKFHNRIGIKNDIKIALYVKARWDDLKEGTEGNNLEAFYLASNTAFSTDAIAYANGTGLKLLGVNAPVEKPFIEEIKALNLYPVTSLKTINKHIKKELLEQNIVVAKDLTKNINFLFRLGMTEEQINQLLREIETLEAKHI